MSAATNAVASSSTALQAASPDVQMSDGGSANETAKKTRRRELGVDASLILSEGRSKRRRTPTPPPKVEKEVEKEEGPKDKARATKLGLEIYKRVVDERDKDGAVMSKPFVRLPPERQYADYYQVIKAPMSLEIVHRKLEAQEYDTLEAVRNDFSLIFNNAKRYNTNESLLFLYAKKLHKLTRTLYEELSLVPNPPSSQHGGTAAEESDSDREGEPVSTYNEQTPGAGEDDGEEGDDKPIVTSSPGNLDQKNRGRKRGNYFKNGPTVYKLIKPALKSLQHAPSRTRMGRILSTMFLSLPNREEFPDYYQVIQAPVSFEQIERKLKDRQYQNYNEFFIDVERMCDNAMYYNEEESDVHQDAVEMKARLPALKAETEQRVSNPQATKTIRIRVPPLQAAAVPYSATPATAAAPALPSVPPPPRPLQQAPPTSSGLPHGVINADLVSRMKSFSQAEQVAWVSSLSGDQHATLQQLMIPPRPTPTPTQTPRPAADSPSIADGTPTLVPNRSWPAVRYMIFGFRPEPNSKKLSSRLQNWRGVANHAATVGQKTEAIEITAFAKKSTNDAAPASPTTGGQGLSAKANGISIASSTGEDGSQSWSFLFHPNVASMTIEIGGGSGTTSCIFVARQV